MLNVSNNPLMLSAVAPLAIATKDPNCYLDSQGAMASRAHWTLVAFCSTKRGNDASVNEA
jgi:hypothetical protein